MGSESGSNIQYTRSQSTKIMMAPSQFFSLFLPFLLLPLAVLSLPDTYLPGPYTVDHVHFDKEIFGSLDHAIDVKSLTLLSPVDGLDPFGLVPIYCITPGELLNFRTPTLIVAGGLDTIPGLGFGPACAPVELGSDRFYNAMAGPTLILNTTQFGHADLLDELEAGANEIIRFCKADKDSDKYSYRVELGGQIVNFLSF